MLRCVCNPANPSGMRRPPSFLTRRAAIQTSRERRRRKRRARKGERKGVAKAGTGEAETETSTRKDGRMLRDARSEGCIRKWKETTRHRVHRSVLNFASMVWVKSFPAEEQALRTHRRTSRFPPRAQFAEHSSTSGMRIPAMTIGNVERLRSEIFAYTMIVNRLIFVLLCGYICHTLILIKCNKLCKKVMQNAVAKNMTKLPMFLSLDTRLIHVNDLFLSCLATVWAMLFLSSFWIF